MSTDNPSDNDPPGDSGTESVQTRWRFTNDVLAGALLTGFLALVGLHGYGLLDVSTFPVNGLITLFAVVPIAAIWTFGAEAEEAVLDRYYGGGESP